MYIRGELRYWITGYKWDTCATLTFHPSTSPHRREVITRLLLNKLDKKLHGNWLKKEGRRCSRVVFAENNYLGSNLHYHLAFIIPKNYKGNIFDFCKLQMKLWKEICGRNIKAEFKPIDDSMGWIDYITKDAKSDNCDNLMLHGSHFDAKDLLMS